MQKDQEYGQRNTNPKNGLRPNYHKLILNASMFSQTGQMNNLDILWNHSYGGSVDEMGYAAIQTSDKGFALAGSIYDPLFLSPAISGTQVDRGAGFSECF